MRTKLPSTRKKQNTRSESWNISDSNNFKLVKITVFAFFLGNFLCVLIGFQTLISIFSFLRILMLLIVLSFLVQRFFFNSFFHMKNMEYLVFSAFGAAPVLMSLFLMLNFFIQIDERNDVYKVERIRFKDSYQYFEVKGIPCEDYPEFCVIHEDELRLRKGMPIEITLSKGLFGYETIKSIRNYQE